MSLSERVYRALLRAYPAEFRREYGESMAQLFRDQLRACAGRWERQAPMWMRTLADTVRAASAAHVEKAMGPQGWLTNSRLSLATLVSLLFMGAGRQVLAHTLFGVQGPFSRLFQAHRPDEFDHRWIYTLAVFSVIDALEVAVTLGLLLLILGRFAISRMGRGALVGLGVAVLCRGMYWRFGLVRLLESEHAFLNWLIPVTAMSVLVMIMRKMRVGWAVVGTVAAVPVVVAVASGLLYLGKVPLAVVTHEVVTTLALVIAAVAFQLILKKLGIGQPARGILVAVPVALSCLDLTAIRELLYFHEFAPGYIVIHFGGVLLLPVSLAAAAWAAGAGNTGQSDTEHGQGLLPT